MNRIPKTLALTFALALTATAAIAAPSTKDIAGRWNGEVTKAGRAAPIPFKLNIPDIKGGEDGAEIRWGAPYTCESTLQFSGKEKISYLFTFNGGNGPFCDRLVNGHVNITPEATDQTALTIYDGRNNRQFVTDIERIMP